MPIPLRFVLIATWAVLALPASAVAGDVIVSVGGGTLKVAATATDDVLTIAGLDASTVTVTPGVGTTVNGSAAAQMFAGVTSGLKIALGDGADDLDVTGVELPAVAIKAGRGADEVRISNAVITRKAAIDLGPDNNALELCTAILPKVAIKSGAPDGTFVEASCGAFLAINADLGSVVAIGDADLRGKLSVTMGSGSDAVAVSDVSMDGDAKIAMGTDSAGVTLCDVLVAGKLSVVMGKPVSGTLSTVVCANSFAEGEVALILDDTTVTGALKLKASAGNDDFVLVNVSAGKSTLDAGNGNNYLALSNVTFNDTLSAKTGKGADVHELASLLMRGDAKFSLGAGANTLTAATSTAESDLTVKAGKDADTIDASGVSVVGTRTIDGGGGMDTIM